jgi:hypothetical protein
MTPPSQAQAVCRYPARMAPLASEIVDLFGTRRQAWLRTPRGVWFLSAGDNLIFLTPSAPPGRYSVARCATTQHGGQWLREDLDLDMAMSWGEPYAAEAAALTRRGAGWRTQEPSQSQVNMAHRMGLPVSPGVTRGELSDAISTAIAAQRLDAMPCVASVSTNGYW